MENKFITRHAKDFSKEEIQRFKNILINAGEVVEYTFDNLIAKNPILLFYPDTKDIQAIGALKIPNNSYKDKVFLKAKSELTPDSFKYELGWVVCLSEGQGIGKAVTKYLSNYKSRIYSTVRERNEIMSHIMESLKFQKNGQSYDSERGNYKNILYIKEKS